MKSYLLSSDLVVVDNNDIGMLHDMVLYRQSRVKLLDEMKKENPRSQPAGCARKVWVGSPGLARQDD